MTAQAPAYFRAVAIDFDGTLADGQVTSGTLAALAEARARQIRVVLVTGRIISELRTVFPDAGDHFDAIVAENGAVLATQAGVRPLAAPVGRTVSAGLGARGVAHRCGQVLVACAAAYEPAASEVIRELGLDCRLARNRGELMIVPAGVTKGTGLIAALDDMGLSRHNAIGVGDAENDHSLLDACEVGVAVAHAVDAIRSHADVVLSSPDGQGVAELLRGPLLAGRGYVHPRRWQLVLGTDDLGQPVTLPASQLNIAIYGGTGDGKSYLAGLILEQLVQLGYSLIVFDPEGDHRGLGKLHGVFVTGGQEDRLADPADIVRLLRNGYSSVVVDASHLDADGQAGYAARLAGEIEAHRAAAGLPQWVAMDEAHGPVGRTGALRACPALTSPGSSTDRPDGPCWPGDSTPRQPVAFTIGTRVTSHLRHEHKYDQTGVEPAHRFQFRTEPDAPTGAVAANLAELEAELADCDEGVLRHHCPGHDFSRWVAGAFRDGPLAADLAAAETSLPAGSPGAVVEQVRLALIAALQDRHPR